MSRDALNHQAATATPLWRVAPDYVLDMWLGVYETSHHMVGNGRMSWTWTESIVHVVITLVREIKKKHYYFSEQQLARVVRAYTITTNKDLW